jgi:AcrR family transcriptional regulator
VSGRARAEKLTPERRRASIIAAALPLLRTYGAGVTTAQIAMAAGVAEGTLFRAFPDKDALIEAAMQTAFDPTETEAALAAIDAPGLVLRDALVAAVEIIQARVERIWQLMAMIGRTFNAKELLARRPEQHDEGMRRQLARIFEAHASEIRTDPAAAARILRMMTFAGSHPRIADGPPLTAAEIVAVVLDGLRPRPDLEVP